MRVWVSGIIALCLGLGASWYVWSVWHRAPEELNLIVVSIDSVRYDHLELYGYGRNTMPHLAHWAKEGVVFENYFATSFLTPISEMSVHTGRYPFNNGVVSFGSTLRGDVPTLAEILRAHGWQTAAFGSSPEFQWFRALASSFSRGFDVFPPRLSGIDDIEDSALRARGDNPVSEATRWLTEKRDHRKPFYLWIPMGSAHWPYGQNFPRVFGDTTYDGYFAHAPSSWQTYGMVYQDKRYRATTTTEMVGGVLSLNYDTNQVPQVVEELRAEDFAYIRDRYDDGLLATDAMLNELFVYLAASGLASNTVVVVQSEHGEAFGETGYIGHYDISEPEVHVPLILWAPGIKPGREDALVSGVDVFPTVLALILGTEYKVDGENFLPYLRGATSTPPRSSVFLTRVPLWESVLSYAFGDTGKEFRRLDDTHRYRDVAVQTKEWKLVHRLSRDIQAKYAWWSWVAGAPLELPEYQLYNQGNDDAEMLNHFGDPRVADSESVLMEQLSEFERNMHTAPSVDNERSLQEYY